MIMTNSSHLHKSHVKSLDLPQWLTVFGITFSLACTLLTLQGNLLILRLFYKHASSLVKPGNVFFVNLCIADLCFAVMVFPFEVVYLIDLPLWPLGVIACKLWQSLYVAFGTVSIFSLSALSVERYYAIKRPMNHGVYFSMTAAVLVSCGLWILGAASGVLYFHILHQPFMLSCVISSVNSIGFSILFLIVDIVIPFVICLVSYARILIIARYQVRRIHLAQRPVTHINPSQQAKYSKARKTISWLVGAFALSCLPFVIFHVIDATLKLKYPYKDHVEHFVKWLSFLNSTCNWALYTLSNRELRPLVLAMLPECVSRLFQKQINIGNAVVIPMSIDNQ